MKDIIIGCFGGYSPTDVSPWVNSIHQSGFCGHLCCIVYGLDVGADITSKYLSSKGFEVVRVPSFSKSIVVDRFKDMAVYLSKHIGKYRYIITTDVGDVVFQTNPSVFLEQRLDDTKDILVGSEYILIKNETWGRENMRISFPDKYDMMKDKIVYNAGTIAAKSNVAMHLFADIYNMSITSRVYNPDQAAMNILVQTKYFDRTYFSSMADGWSIQCGTSVDPSRLREYEHLLIEKSYKFIEGVGFTESESRVCLIHQYNRVPWLYDTIKTIYEERL